MAAETPLPRITPRLILGAAILILGILWTLDNLNVIESEEVTQWWPMVLVLIGITQFFSRSTNRVGPVVLTIVGFLLLGATLDLIQFDLGDLIPLAIAAWGAKLIWDALARRSSTSVAMHTNDDSVVHSFAMMAGVRWQSTSHDFRGGDANAIMGGVVLDLRNTQIRPGQDVVIDVLAIMGGVEVFVPQGWKIVANVLPIMGGFEDNTLAGGTGPQLTVRGTVIMGAIEMKN